MLRVALAFFLLALVSILFGAYGLAGLSMEAAKVCLYVFLIVAVVFLIGGLTGGHRPGPMAR